MSVLVGNKLNFYDYEVSDTLAYNLEQWLNWGLLELGAYTTVTLNDPQTSGYSVLKAVQDERFPVNASYVYEGLGPSWVWENGVSVPSGYNSIFQASGVYINNTFYPTNTTTGVNSHYIDYRYGRVVFPSGLTKGTQVQCEYVFRDIAIYQADSHHWRTIIQEYTQKYNQLDQLSPSGMADILKSKRIWLPCVIIDVQDSTFLPLQLGGGELAEIDVDYHIFSDNNFASKRLSDLLSSQKFHTLSLFDINKAPKLLDYRGVLQSGSLTYPVLTNRSGQYFMTYGYIKESSGGVRRTITDVNRAEIRHTIEIERYLSTF